MNEKDYIKYQLVKMYHNNGYVPRYDEFIEHIGGTYYIKKHFKTYNNLLHECDLPLNYSGKKYSMNYSQLISFMISTFNEYGIFPTVADITSAGISKNIIRNTGMTYSEFKDFVYLNHIVGGLTNED